MKLKELIQLRQILGALANQKMSIKSSYSVARFISQTNDAEVIYNQKIQELINEFGNRDEQGNFKQDENGNISIKDGVEQECNDRIAEIDNFEVETPALTIVEKDIDNLDSKIELSPAELFILLDNIK